MLSRSSLFKRDSGMVTLLYLAVCGPMLLLIGLIYDGGGELDAYRGGDELAKEAARAEAQCLDIPGYLQTGVPTVRDPNLPAFTSANPTVTNPAASCAQPVADAAQNGVPAQSPSLTRTYPAGTAIKISSITVVGSFVTVEVTITRPTIFSALGFQTVAKGHATVKLTQGVTDAGG